MAAPAKFLFDVDFAAGSPREPTLTVAEHGAKLDMKDKQNRTPIDMALLPTPDPGNTPKPGHLATAALLRQYQ